MQCSGKQCRAMGKSPPHWEQAPRPGLKAVPHLVQQASRWATKPPDWPFLVPHLSFTWLTRRPASKRGLERWLNDACPVGWLLEHYAGKSEAVCTVRLYYLRSHPQAAYYLRKIRWGPKRSGLLSPLSERSSSWNTGFTRLEFVFKCWPWPTQETSILFERAALRRVLLPCVSFIAKDNKVR